MTIEWKRGSQFKVDPKVAYGVVETIRKRNNGDAEPHLVVEEAKKKRSPIHGEFEWDDAAAAQEHRLERARNMLRSFVIVRPELKTDRPQRVYEVVRSKASEEEEPRKVYRTMEQIMADPNTRAELLGRALRELVVIRNRYRDLQELAVVMRSIDEVLETVEV